MPILFGLTLIIIVFISFSKSRDKKGKKSLEEFWKKEQESNFVPRKDISSLDYITISYSSLPFRYYTPEAGNATRISSGSKPASESTGLSDEIGSFSVVTESSDAHRIVDELLSELDATEAPLPESTYVRTGDFSAPMAEELAAAELELCKLAGCRILNLTGISNTELRLTYGTANLDLLSAYDQNFTTLIRALQKWGTLLASAERKEDAVTVLAYAVTIGSDIAGTYALLARLYKERGEYHKIEALKESAEELTTVMKPSILRDLEQVSEQVR